MSRGLKMMPFYWVTSGYSRIEKNSGRGAAADFTAESKTADSGSFRQRMTSK